MVMRHIVVTGGLGAIGFAIAAAFAKEGAVLSLLDVHDDEAGRCDTLRRAGAGDVRTFKVDVADEDALAAAMAQACDAFGPPAVMISVAGVMIYKKLADLSAQDWRRNLDVNLVGAAVMTGEAFRRMAPGGVILYIASIHAHRTSPLVAPYAAAKAALTSLARSAAIEGKAVGIRANAILPGAIDTPMLRDSPNIRSGIEQLDPADIGRPEDIAAVATFLASDGARFVTGEEIVVDGGRLGAL